MSSTVTIGSPEQFSQLLQSSKIVMAYCESRPPHPARRLVPVAASGQATPPWFVAKLRWELVVRPAAYVDGWGSQELPDSRFTKVDC